MNFENVIVPSKTEVQIMLEYAIDNKVIDIQTIGELLGMKLIDSLMPKIKGEPDWGYDGLRKFFMDHGLKDTDTLEEALHKLK